MPSLSTSARTRPPDQSSANRTHASDFDHPAPLALRTQLDEVMRLCQPLAALVINEADKLAPGELGTAGAIIRRHSNCALRPRQFSRRSLRELCDRAAAARLMSPP
jgi:hypothetical protein